MAAAEAKLVVAKARVAVPLAARAEPALNPNQPNQSSPVPNTTKGILAGAAACPWVKLWRLPKKTAPARAAKPALMCTTVPPAKSRTPHLRKKPLGCQVQCAKGV